MCSDLTWQGLDHSRALRACEERGSEPSWQKPTYIEGWIRNEDHMKHGFEKNTLVLELGWTHPRFEPSDSLVASALALSQLQNLRASQQKNSNHGFSRALLSTWPDKINTHGSRYPFLASNQNDLRHKPPWLSHFVTGIIVSKLLVETTAQNITKTSNQASCVPSVY